jgi:hypothetical protein
MGSGQERARVGETNLLVEVRIGRDDKRGSGRSAREGHRPAGIGFLIGVGRDGETADDLGIIDEDLHLGSRADVERERERRDDPIRQIWPAESGSRGNGHAEGLRHPLSPLNRGYCLPVALLRSGARCGAVFPGFHQ